MLVARLLLAGDKAAAAGRWERVEEIAQDVLAVAPEDERALRMLRVAQGRQALAGGQRALVSMLFSDMVRSTDLAEASQPETMRDLFTVYRDVATKAIEGLQGSILGFQGDGIVACFGHPKANEDDAQRAVRAGLAIVDGLRRAAPDLRERLGVEASVRVGIHTGVVVAWQADRLGGGPDVVGPTANMAARLQSMAQPDTVVISEVTKALVQDSFELQSLGKRLLKGIAEPVEVFSVNRTRPVAARLDAVKLHSAVLVGRDEVQGRLLGVWRESCKAAERSAPAPRPMVVLRGPPGIGKSRVVADISERVRGLGGEIMHMSCSAYHANVALWPLARLLEFRLGLHADQSPEEQVAVLQRTAGDRGLEASAIPLVASVLGLDGVEGMTQPDLDPLARRAQTLLFLARWLALVAAATPVLLVVDVLQWADPTSVELLDLILKARIPGLLILIGSREPLPEGWREGALDIELRPLDGDEARALALEIAHDTPLEEEQLQQIVERAGGIPLFVEELARSAATMGKSGGLPLRLHELLTARLHAPEIDLRVAQLAATVGPMFDATLLTHLAGASVERALADLQTAGIIEPLGVGGQSSYSFSHVLLRDAAYETQVLEVRRDTHLRIARTMQASPSASPGAAALVAQHLDLAEESLEAVAAYIQAAQQAQAAASHVEARGLLTRALTLLATTPAGQTRDLTELLLRMLRGLSVSSVFGFPHPEVLEDFEAADELCRLHTDRPEVMPATVGIWSYFFTRGEHGTAQAALERVSEGLDGPQGSWFAPEIRGCMGYDAFFAGDLNEARRLFEEAWAGFMDRPVEARVSPFWGLPNDPVSSSATLMSCVAALQGRMAESELWRERAQERVDQLVFPRGPFTLALETLYQAWLAMIFGDEERTNAHGLEVLDIAQRHGFGYLSLLGAIWVPEGDDGQGGATGLGQAIAAIEPVGHKAFVPAYLSRLARAQAAEGDVAKALGTVEDALLLMQKLGEMVLEPDLLRMRARFTAQLAPERMDEVVSDLETAVRVGLTQGSPVLALLAAVDLGRLGEAVRPAHWRRTLERAYDRLAGAECPGIREAAALLAT
ncbi:MAG: AAA family ATPase [Actinomycetota bacterium]